MEPEQEGGGKPNVDIPASEIGESVLGAHSGTGGDAAGFDCGIGSGGNLGCCASPPRNEETKRSLSSWAARNAFKLSGCVQPSVPPPFSRSMIRMSSNLSRTILAHLTSWWKKFIEFNSASAVATWIT